MGSMPSSCFVKCQCGAAPHCLPSCCVSFCCSPAPLATCRQLVFFFRSPNPYRRQKVRDNPKIFFVYWTVQALWVFLTALPTYMVLSVDDVAREQEEHEGSGVHKQQQLEEQVKMLPRRGRPTPYDYAGAALWLSGFVTQVLADRQKSAFLADPANRGRFITGGLWSASQHPNYFGGT